MCVCVSCVLFSVNVFPFFDNINMYLLLQRLNMMLVLDPNGALFIYSSLVKVCISCCSAVVSELVFGMSDQTCPKMHELDECSLFKGRESAFVLIIQRLDTNAHSSLRHRRTTVNTNTSAHKTNP